MHEIGTGVLGPVFRAYQPPHDHPFAVKVFHVDITPEQAETLAERLGAVVVAGAFHPGVVPATAVGVDDGVLYLAQEYVAGDALDAVMRNYSPAALDQALPLIDRLAGAIDAAHTRGMRHGGLHLRDVIVTPSGGRVTGFGVVAALEEVGVSGPIRRPYAAPETIARRPCGPAADRFALAAIAYELLTGRRAAGTGAQVADRLAQLDEVADVESLQAVFETALADGADSRYASAARFAADLHAAVGVPFDEAALDLTPAPLPADGVEPAEGGEAAGESAEPAAEIRVDPLPGVAPRRGEDAERGLAAEPVEDHTGAEVGAAEPVAKEQRPAPESGPDRRAEPEPAFEATPESEPEPEHAAEPGSRRPAPSLIAATALERESEPEPVVKRTRASDAVRTRRAPGLFDDEDLLDLMDEPEARDERAGAAADGRDDDVLHQRSASGSVVATAVVLSVGAVAAYLVGLQLAGNQSPPADRGAGRELASPEAGAASDRGGAPASIADSSPRAGAAPAPARPALQPPAQVTPSFAESPVPPAPRGSSLPPQLAAPVVPASPAAPEPPAPPPVATAGWLLIRTEPPGALVTIAGVDRGRTPLALRDMPFDTYRVEVSREGFLSQSADLTLSPTATVASIAIELPRGTVPPPAPTVAAPADSPSASQVGALRIESRPAGARVFIDGRAVGTTPTVVSDVAAGTRSLRLELDGYLPWVTSVDVSASDQVRVGASLELVAGR